MAFRAFDLTRWTLGGLRRLLYLGIRTQVFPEPIAQLALDPDVPVCYVLQYRHLTNLLVLQQECLRHGLPAPLDPISTPLLRTRRSSFFLTRSSGRGAKPDTSVLLQQLLDAGIANPELNIQIVPVTILWGRAPLKQDSILKALFSETWRATGWLRQLLAIVFHGRDTVVRFNAPLSLRELLQDEADRQRAERKLGRILRVHFRRQREMAIGPDLSHRHMLIRTLLATPAVRAAIAVEAAAKSLEPGVAEQRARQFAREIASDYSYAVIRALDLFLHWLWTRIYDGIEVHNFERVTDIAAGQGIVYVPCHRSHIDYLLLSFLIFRRGLMPPHIAAGANLNMPLVGPLLRHGGAFFLRRTLKGEPLYAAVFVAYLHHMIDRGVPIEYFIEGGRSRSGRMLAPKAGILAMTVQSFVRSHSRPLVFVPVYIGYEKLMEGSTYVAELGGKPKKKESLLGILLTARRLRREFGRVRVNFGHPLALAGLLDAQHPDWPTENADPKAPWLRSAVLATANELSLRINDAATINPINLVALALLATPRHVADRQLLQRQIEHLQALLEAAPYGDTLIPCLSSSAEIIDHALHIDAVEQVPHALGDLIRAEPRQAALLAYFRNNVLHVFLLPSLLACLVSQNRLLSQARAREAIHGLYALLRTELFLHWPPEELDTALDAVETALIGRGMISRDPQLALWRAPEPNSDAYADLRQLGEIVRPTLDRLFLALTILQHHGSGTLTRTTFTEAGQLLAERLSLLYAFGGSELADKSVFAQTLVDLTDAEFVTVSDDGRLCFDEHILRPARYAELLLPAEVRHTIERMTRNGGSATSIPHTAPAPR